MANKTNSERNKQIIDDVPEEIYFNYLKSDMARLRTGAEEVIWTEEG
jgi:hypothetical protein